jgi:hypothetical protein
LKEKLVLEYLEKEVSEKVLEKDFLGIISGERYLKD